MRNCVSELIIMVQDEVARRSVGKPCTSDYSSLTVFLNFYSKPEYGFKVGKMCFYPSPKVDSAVVRLTLKPAHKVSDQDSFFRMVREAFKHRRKMLRSSLKNIYPSAHIEEVLNKLQKSHMSRPEELALEELISLFEILEKLKTE
jgi:16S rRNA (adenine1518-N6/adenine1519-N6)-dimethyltransferase